MDIPPCRRRWLPSADPGDGELPLHRLVKRGDQRFEFHGCEELHLIEEEDDAAVLLLGASPSATRTSVRSSPRLPLSARPSAASTSNPNVSSPCAETVT